MVDIESSSTSLDNEQFKEKLLRILLKFTALKRQNIDVHQLKDVVASLEVSQVESSLNIIAQKMALSAPRYSQKCDPARLPCIAFTQDGHLQIVLGWEGKGGWVVGELDTEGNFSETRVSQFLKGTNFAHPDLQTQFVAHKSQTLKIILGEVFKQTRFISEMVLAGIFIMFLAITISLFSIQVYDRVIPSSADATLLVLASGALLALIFELLLKFSRSSVVERMTDVVDQRLARNVMSRFLGVRLENLPQSVGSATQVLKGYETVRSFLVSLLTTITVDFPVAIFLLFVVFLIAGPLAYIPAVFFVIGILFALYFQKKSDALAGLSQNAHSRKTGILVESIEGAETIKANNARWRILSQWLSVTDDARQIDNRFRHVSEHSQYILMFFQQASYIAIISVGAMKVIDGSLTVGGLIGCSILSGRILTPVSQLPKLMINWANSKMALKSLEHYWHLRQETEEQSCVFVESFTPQIEASNVSVPCYGPGTLRLEVPRLLIPQGSHIGVIGSVGSGKSSLLRLLTGLISADEGQVQLSNVNIEHFDRATLASHIGYVSQDGRLISGTIRDNLILGLPDPGDQEILKICQTTGVLDFIIKPSPKGLDTFINESGGGLSGGQKQLIHLTRALLKKPALLVLDEPTASLDQLLEMRILTAIKTYCENFPDTTIILVTHKTQLFALVDRLIVMASGKIVLDGLRDDVLKQLNANIKGEQ